MIELLEAWLTDHDADSLFSFDLVDGKLTMYGIDGKTFFVRVYESQQDWEIYVNLNPKNFLTRKGNLAALDEWLSN